MARNILRAIFIDFGYTIRYIKEKFKGGLAGLGIGILGLWGPRMLLLKSCLVQALEPSRQAHSQRKEEVMAIKKTEEIIYTGSWKGFKESRLLCGKWLIVNFTLRTNILQGHRSVLDITFNVQYEHLVTLRSAIRALTEQLLGVGAMFAQSSMTPLDSPHKANFLFEVNVGSKPGEIAKFVHDFFKVLGLDRPDELVVDWRYVVQDDAGESHRWLKEGAHILELAQAQAEAKQT